jgi:hypothetical protein
MSLYDFSGVLLRVERIYDEMVMKYRNNKTNILVTEV